jgi:hypothetical protein
MIPPRHTCGEFRPSLARRYLFLFGLLSLALPCFAQAKSELRPPPPLDPVQAEREARSLVEDLLNQKPQESITNTGLLTIRDAANKKKEFPIRFEVITTPTNWISVFETVEVTPGERLVIIHCASQPNRYELGKPDEKKVLVGNQAMVPFLGSDFWAVDLGLEFLHWPKQRLLRKEMIRSQFCAVLESSVGPAPTNGYSRVVSWIDLDSLAIVRGEAYDSRNELWKRFDPTELKKIEGKYELEEMGMRNRKTQSETRVKFNLKK